MLPAGRFVRAVFGDQAFAPGLYTFEECDLSRIADPDRANQYCGWNPGALPLSILAIPSSPALIQIRWLAAEGARHYDVWGQDRRVASGVTGTDYTFQGIPCGIPSPTRSTPVTSEGASWAVPGALLSSRVPEGPCAGTLHAGFPELQPLLCQTTHTTTTADWWSRETQATMYRPMTRGLVANST